MKLFSTARKFRSHGDIVQGARIKPKNLDDSLPAEPTGRKWRVLTDKKGREFVTSKNPNALIRKLYGIKNMPNETGRFTSYIRGTAKPLSGRLGNNLATTLAHEYFQKADAVRDCDDFRKHNRVLAASAIVYKEVLRAEQCVQDMRNHRAALQMMGPKQPPHIAKAHQNAVPLAEALNSGGAQGQSATGLRKNVQERIEGACAKRGTSVGQYIEALLLETPVARYLEKEVFGALIDIYEDAENERLAAMLP